MPHPLPSLAPKPLKLAPPRIVPPVRRGPAPIAPKVTAKRAGKAMRPPVGPSSVPGRITPKIAFRQTKRLARV